VTWCDGDPIGEPCPRVRCDGNIVYNGNYFCDACGHGVGFNQDRLLGLIRYRASRGDDTEREESYLDSEHLELWREERAGG
jgi:hypothetical protein